MEATKSGGVYRVICQRLFCDERIHSDHSLTPEGLAAAQAAMRRIASEPKIHCVKVLRCDTVGAVGSIVDRIDCGGPSRTSAVEGAAPKTERSAGATLVLVTRSSVAAIEGDLISLAVELRAHGASPVGGMAAEHLASKAREVGRWLMDAANHVDDAARGFRAAVDGANTEIAKLKLDLEYATQGRLRCFNEAQSLRGKVAALSGQLKRARRPAKRR